MVTSLPSESAAKLAKVKMVIFDVDGVLTDGGIAIDHEGLETKTFHVHDGSGIKYLMRAGLQVALLSGRVSAATEHRAKELGVTEVHQGAKLKLPVFEEILGKHRLPPEEVCYVGDDLPDLPVMRKVGFAVAVVNARPEVLEAADYVTAAAGGAGAARELAELLLRVQDKWGDIFRRYE